MKVTKRNITCCVQCPFYDGYDPKEPPVCDHKNSPDWPDDIVSRSHFKPDPIPKWCPLVKEGGKYTKVVRDAYDNIRQKIHYSIKL